MWRRLEWRGGDGFDGRSQGRTFLKATKFCFCSLVKHLSKPTIFFISAGWNVCARRHLRRSIDILSWPPSLPKWQWWLWKLCSCGFFIKSFVLGNNCQQCLPRQPDKCQRAPGKNIDSAQPGNLLSIPHKNWHLMHFHSFQMLAFMQLGDSSPSFSTFLSARASGEKLNCAQLFPQCAELWNVILILVF